jgi:hypothetical protein
MAIKEWRLVERNPVRDVSKRKETRGRIRFLSDAERDALLEACEKSEWPALRTLLLLAISTGARRASGARCGRAGAPCGCVPRRASRQFGAVETVIAVEVRLVVRPKFGQAGIQCTESIVGAVGTTSRLMSLGLLINCAIPFCSGSAQLPPQTTTPTTWGKLLTMV